jgi:hypothetical protein
MKKDTLVKTVDLDAMLQADSIQTEATIVTEPKVIVESVIETPIRMITESEYDEIIREWFYRLPKGFAEVPYTNEEFTVLNEVMVERGYDPLTASVMQLQLELSAIDEADDTYDEEYIGESFITEDDAADLTADDIIRILSSGKRFSPKVLNRIGKLIKRDADTDDIIEERLLDILGPDAKHTDNILDIMHLGNTDEVKLASYMQKRTVSFKKFTGTPKSINSIFSETGLSDKALDALSTYRWSATPAVGPVEVLLAILLKGGARPSGGDSGDLVVDGKKFEVKGLNARLKGQSGFGTPAAVRKAFYAGYSALAKEYGIETASLSGGAKKKANALDIITDQAAWGSGQWIKTLNTMNQQIINIVGDDPSIYGAIAKAMGVGFSGMLEHLDSKDFAWIERYIKRDGTLDVAPFIIDLAEVAFNYYVRETKVDWFVVTNASESKSAKKGDKEILIFPVSDFKSHIGTHIGIVIPAFNDSAGVQGPNFGLKLGSKSKLLQ